MEHYQLALHLINHDLELVNPSQISDSGSTCNFIDIDDAGLFFQGLDNQ